MNESIREFGEIKSSKYKDQVKKAKKKSKEIIQEIKKGNTNAFGNALIYHVTVPILNALVFLRFLENIIKKGGDGKQYWTFKLYYYDENSGSVSSKYSESLNEVINENLSTLENKILFQGLNENSKIFLSDEIVGYINTFIGITLPDKLPVDNYIYQLVKNDDVLYVNGNRLMVEFNQDFRGGKKKRKTKLKRKRNKKRKTKKNRFV